MRTKFFIILILTAIIPSTVFAQTDTSVLILSLQKQILQLLTQIQTLQKEVTELKTETGIQSSPVSSPFTPLSPISESDLPEFTRPLSLGARGDDVRKLQEFLARDKDIYPEGLTTGFYGPRTVEAVRRWQRKNNVEAVGTVGPKTIARFRELGQVPRLGSGQGVVRGLIEQGAPSGMVPPGLLTAPGIQKQIATSTSSGQATTSPMVIPPMMATATPPVSTPATTTPAVPAIPAEPATPAVPGVTSAVPATPATPATPTTATTTTSVEFSNVQVSNITSGSAVVTWTANKSSDSMVAYTTKSTCISGNLIITGGGAEWYDCTRSGVGGVGSNYTNTTAHQVTLSLLSPSTHYYYQPVFPGDAFGSGKVPGPILTFDTPSSTVSPAVPDLIIQTQASVTPSSPTVNQWATVGFRIQNWSSSASLSNFVPTFAVETTAGSADISNGTSPNVKIQNTRHDCPVILGPLRDCLVQFDINYTTSGSKTFYVRLDPQNQIAEANETNNSTTSVPFTVVSPTPGDTTPPTITLAVGYPNLTAQTQPVYVGFNTNEEAKVIYEYGLTTAYGSIQTVWDQYWTANGIYLPTLNSGTTYHIRAKATDRAGNIGYSQDYAFTTSGTSNTSAPAAPSGLTATASTNSIAVSWTDNSTGEWGFRLKRRVQGSTSWFGLASVFNNNTGNSVSFTDSYQLTPNTIYEYIVHSYNTYDSAGSNIVTVNFGGTSSIDTSPPSTPTGVVATVISSSQINLSWNASTDNVGVTAYQVFRNGLFWYQTPNLSAQDTGLSPNTSYSYYVRALDAALYTSSPSTTVSATTPSGTTTSSTATTANCFVKVNGTTIKSVSATDRNDCYKQTSFGSQNCSVYDSYFQGGSNLLEQYFGQTDRVNSDTCVKSTSSTATTTSAVLDSLNGLLIKLMELLRK